MRDRPLVSFALFAYNQEKYIQEAIKAAFAQTYSPMEIILSDDCSSDNTFQLMQQMTDSYSGSHKIILNRNHINLGVGKHINILLSLCSGELVVLAAGDDVSAPNRTSTICDHWIANGEPPALCSNFWCIDSEGKQIPCPFPQPRLLTARMLENEECLKSFIRERKYGLTGCTEAWSRKVFELFGPLREGIVAEDAAFAFRAWLVDKIVFISDDLVAYRLHSDNICNKLKNSELTGIDFYQREQNSMNWARWGWELWTGYLEDLQKARNNRIISNELFQELKFHINNQIRLQYIKKEWWSVNSYRRFLWWFICLKIGGLNEAHSRFIRLLPEKYYLCLRNLLTKTSLRNSGK